MADTEFYGYKHWTLEEMPRCFYVGKGQASRPGEGGCMRNHKWRGISKRYGLRIEVCIGPISHEDALTWEVEWVAKENTFSTNHSHDDPSDIGCNFTKGGHGAVGFKHTEETRRVLSKKAKARGKLSLDTKVKIKQTLTGRKNGPPSKDHREKLRVALRRAHAENPDWKRPIMSDEAKARISLANRGKKRSDETRRKLSASHKGKPTWNKGKRGIYSEETIAKIKAARARQTERAKLATDEHSADDDGSASKTDPT